MLSNFNFKHIGFASYFIFLLFEHIFRMSEMYISLELSYADGIKLIPGRSEKTK